MGKKTDVAKEFLRQVKTQDVQINNMLEELAKLRLLSTKITSTLRPDAISGGGTQDKLGNVIAKIIDMESEINEAIDSFVDSKREVRRVIDCVEDPDQLDVLQKHYILHETLEQIAQEKYMSHRNICYIHGRALQAVAAILEEKGEGI